MLASFPLDNPQDERLHDLMEKMRGRFKAIVAMLGLIQDYMPRGKLDVSGAAQALARVSSREPEITGTLASEEMAASTRASVSPGADMTF
ncbi:Yae1_N domain-containing protein, partial [Haematococcus lacustris]